MAARIDQRVDAAGAAEDIATRPFVDAVGRVRLARGGKPLGGAGALRLRPCPCSVPAQRRPLKAVRPLEEAWAVRRMLVCVREGRTVDSSLQRLLDILCTY